MNKHPVLIATLLLSLFAVAGSALVAFTHQQTAPRIEQNEREALLGSLNALVPPARIDNDIIGDTLTVSDPRLLGTEQTTVYRGFNGKAPVAAVFTTQVPDGYSGPIKLLVGVAADGNLTGVRVVSHRETPGLGDKIEPEKSDWLKSFEGRNLQDPPEAKWGVKRDGGVFDQFTGATITPRSIVKAVKNTLLYFRDHQAELFANPPGGEAQAASRPAQEHQS